MAVAGAPISSSLGADQPYYSSATSGLNLGRAVAAANNQVPVQGIDPYGPQAMQYYRGIQQAQAAPPAQAQFADFMTPAMQQYVNQFKTSQAQQQQAINAGLMQALQGLGSRRDAAAAVAATVPGAYEAAYKEASQNAAQAAKNASFGPDHPATIGANADAQLIAQSNASQLAAGKGAQPLLNAGITADYSKGKTALQNTQMQNQAALADKQQAFDMQMLQAQAQWQQQQQAAQMGYNRDVALAKLNSSLSLQNWRAENPQAALTPDQQLQLQNQQQLNTHAINSGFTSYDDMQRTVNSTPYQRAVSQLQSGTQPTQTAVQNGKLVTTVKGGPIARLDVLRNLDQNTLNALVANNIITVDDIAAVNGYAPPKK